MEGLYLNKQAP